MPKLSFKRILKDLTTKSDPYADTLKWIDEHNEDDYRELLGFKKDYSLSKEHPMFLTPTGNVLDVIAITNKTNHEHFAFMLANKVMDMFYINMPDRETEEELGIKTYYKLIEDKDWIALNPGSKSTGGRPYFLMRKAPTNVQYTVIEDFLNKVWENGKEDVEVQISKSGTGTNAEVEHKFYKFNDVFPEDIVKRVKKYFATGRLEEKIEEE